MFTCLVSTIGEGEELFRLVLKSAAIRVLDSRSCDIRYGMVKRCGCREIVGGWRIPV